MPSLATLDPRTPRPARITRRTQETDDVFTIELDVSDRPGGFPFAPGQFNMLWQFGAGEVPISISGDPSHPERLVHTIRTVGPVTRAIGAMKKGDAVGLRGPYGSCWPVGDVGERDVVVVAGGLGLAPLRPAIEALARRRGRGRLVVLAGARTPADLLFPKDLARWGRAARTEVLRTVDRADELWDAHVGVVPALIEHVTLDPASTIALVCGPEIMMRFSLRALARVGLRQEQVYLSMERSMKCGVGLCGHCQLGPHFLCEDGPVLRFDRLAATFGVKEV